MAESGDEVPRSSTAPMRKKFAVPPVKIACLSCRASRTRCNGDHPCASCVTKDRECVYKPSRRGGPRIRKKSRPLSDYHDLATSLPPKTEELPQQELNIEDYIGPGAGLKPLADIFQDSDAIYDHLFQNPIIDTSFDLHVPITRTYGNDDGAILNAYYIWIHPYFPILPPPEQVPEPDQPLALAENQSAGFQEPSSAISLAISAILALIPCPHDANPSSGESVRWRRTYSQFLAKSSLECIENENERPESSVEPSRALNGSDDYVFREKFHPKVPLEIESIIALDLLSVYEYAQRGNLKKMRARAGAALVGAMTLFLHTKDDTEDEYSEARRRAWWMTYICVCQGSIVSNTPPTFEAFGSSFTARYPTIRADPHAWSTFVRSQQAILAATQFVIEFNKARKTGSGMTRIYQRMQELEKLLEPLIIQSESWPSNYSLTQPVDRSEAVLANALRCMSRIKLNSARIKVHRYCAFFDIAVFSGKHCDLASLPGTETNNSDPQRLQACCITTLHSPPSASNYSTGSLSPSTTDSPSPGSTDHVQSPVSEFPFSNHESSRICLKSALNIAASFDAMPYPNPTGQYCEGPIFLGSRTPFMTPRTMPSFACCAMQCSYALLMVKDRTEALYPRSNGGSSVLVDNLRGRLQQGLLSVFATLENYATAFEALGGMRDQIRDKIDLQIDFDA
ncbi:putative C6 zinc finger domain-containing protein [Rosellinia necatrix]|uniref:Putative C6 zinc finger domain-containing protein n=1 Tax=Rosellinia necatrix TaxID=77044 RepID=A0A1W2TUJ7_ROSNE|nr:putative C6 zinc finger domain-containing protein [Rosellinia necatrix]